MFAHNSLMTDLGLYIYFFLKEGLKEGWGICLCLHILTTPFVCVLLKFIITDDLNVKLHIYAISF